MKKSMNKIMENGKAVIIPMDHGVSEGPIDGIRDINAAVKNVSKYATGILLHKGMIKALAARPKCGMILHGSAGTKLAADPNYKIQVATPAEAVKMKCDGFSLHVNVGGCEHEQEMLATLARAAEECDSLEMPLLVMMYPRGKNVVKASANEISLVARAGAELGADIVKCPYSGDVQSFRQVVNGCPVPVVIAGGAKSNSDRDVFEMISGAMEAGAVGVSLGRNAFQHKTPEKMVQAIRGIVMKNISVEEALEILGK